MNNLYIVQQTEYGPDCISFISGDTEVDTHLLTFHFSSAYIAQWILDLPWYKRIYEVAKRVTDKVDGAVDG